MPFVRIARMLPRTQQPTFKLSASRRCQLPLPSRSNWSLSILLFFYLSLAMFIKLARSFAKVSSCRSLVYFVSLVPKALLAKARSRVLSAPSLGFPLTTVQPECPCARSLTVNSKVIVTCGATLRILHPPRNPHLLASAHRC